MKKILKLLYKLLINIINRNGIYYHDGFYISITEDCVSISKDAIAWKNYHKIYRKPGYYDRYRPH